MNTSTDKKKYAISEHLIAVAEANCDSCGKQDKMTVLELDDAVDGFYLFGWRVKDGRLLCPKCRRSG